jgi:hypothetical protein
MLFVSKRRSQNQTPKPRKLSWVRFPVKMVSVARILSTTERCQRKIRSFRRGAIATNATTPKSVLGSSPDEVLCSSKTKHKRRTVLRQNLFVSERRLQELRVQARKLSWVRVSVNILGLGINFLFYSKIRDSRDDIRHDTYEPTTRAPTIGVATPTQDAIFAQMSLGKPQDTTFTNRCREWRRLPSQRRLQLQIKPKGTSRRHTWRYSQTDTERWDPDKIFHI